MLTTVITVGAGLARDEAGPGSGYLKYDASVRHPSIAGNPNRNTVITPGRLLTSATP